jgi:NADPH2:quinone reductase
VGFPEAALVEPVSCAVHGVDRLQPVPGDTGLIVGAGTMGIILARLLRLAGVDPVVLCDVKRERREWAARNGFEHTVERVDEALNRWPGGFDVVIEASGAPQAMEDAINAVARGGKLLVFGVAAGDARVSVAPFRLYNDELTIIGSMAVLASFGRALDLVASGRIDAASIVSARFPLEAFGDALEAVRSGKQLKVQIAPNDRS